MLCFILGLTTQEGTHTTTTAAVDIPATNVVRNPNPAHVADHHMPAAIITRIMRRVLPGHARISDDAREAIQECVSEFIGFITEEAKEKCQLESRRVLTANDLLAAMEALGFDNYVETLTLFLSRHRAQDYGRGSTSQLPGVRPDGDFARRSPVAQMARPPPPPPSVATSSSAATDALDGDEYITLAQFISEYILGNQGGGEGSSSGGGSSHV